MADFHIYKVYSERRKLNPEGQINLSDQENEVKEHKAKIAMDLILEYTHIGKDITDEEEECNIGDIKFCEFCWWIQSMLPEDDQQRKNNKKPKNH